MVVIPTQAMVLQLQLRNWPWRPGVETSASDYRGYDLADLAMCDGTDGGELHRIAVHGIDPHETHAAIGRSELCCY